MRKLALALYLLGGLMAACTAISIDRLRDRSDVPPVIYLTVGVAWPAFAVIIVGAELSGKPLFRRAH